MNKNPIRGNIFLAVLLFLFIFDFGLNGQAKERNKDLDSGGCDARTADLCGGNRSVTGSTVNSVFPASVSPGTTQDICFSVTHVDTDYEYLDRFDVDLPDSWTVNSVTNTPDNNGCGDGTTQGVSAGNVVYWQTVGTLPTACGSWDDVTVSFCVNVTVPDCTGAPWTIPWNITGDGYGGAPHTLAGTVPLDCGVPTGEPVLVISPDNDISSLLTALSAYPEYYPVRWNNASGNPTAADLAPYCTVVIGNDLTWESAALTKATIGDALADYLDAGGHVIESEYVQSYDNWGFAGRYMSGGYSPFTATTGDNWNPDSMTIAVPAHPVMAGVTSITDNFGQQNPGLASGATLLATWSSAGNNAVAVKPNAVALNMLLCKSADWTGDIPLLLNNALNWLCSAITGPVIKADGAALTAENCIPGNGVIDPAETVTVNLGLKNTGITDTTDLAATLQSSGGIISPAVSQNYGVIVAGGATVTRAFTFTVDPALACGGTVTLTLALLDGAADLGTVTFTMTSGVIILSAPVTFSNAASIAIPSSGAATPYPSAISVIGVTGVVNKVTATITNISHTFPDDINVLLVGPAGQKMILMQNAGSGTDITNLTLAFDDAAATSLPDATAISSGTYKPSQYGTVAIYPAPAPAGPYGTKLDAFNGTDPNGIWNLFVFDDASGDSGSINGGWSLTITPQSTDCCSGCPTITLSPASPLPDGALAAPYSQILTASGGAIVYTYAVTAGTLPAGLVLGTDGVVSGTPTAPGTYNFTVTATDLVGCTGSQAYSLTVPCPTITLSPASLPDGTVGTPYSQSITASGGTAPYTYAVTAGSPPTGVNLAADGTLTGTPTLVGTFGFTVTVTDTYSCTGSQGYSVQIVCLPPGAPVITNISDNDACSQSGISITFSAGTLSTRHDLYRDAVLVLSGVASPINYNPGDTASHSYVIRAINTDVACFTDSAPSAFTDQNLMPSQPTITGITDPNKFNFGLIITYTPGTPATNHHLYKDGVLAVANFPSGGTYIGSNTMTHSYQIAAVNGTCITLSPPVNAADQGSRIQPRPRISSIEPLPSPF
jgi:subtilisin-like proprotein convertase family protein